MELLTLADAYDQAELEASGLDTANTFPGHTWLDKAAGHWRRGSMTIVGARTNVGKSYYCLYLLGAAEGARGLYVSLEDPAVEIGRRVRPMPAWRRSEVLLSCPERPTLGAIKQAIIDSRADLVVVDYLQAIANGETAAWSQADEVGQKLVELKSLARERRFALVLAVQVRRPAPGGKASEPQLWELRDSSNIENMAERVLMLHPLGDGLRVRLAKSKSTAVGKTAFYSRAAGGWLQESAEPELFDEDEE